MAVLIGLAACSGENTAPTLQDLSWLVPPNESAWEEQTLSTGPLGAELHTASHDCANLYRTLGHESETDETRAFENVDSDVLVMARAWQDDGNVVESLEADLDKCSELSLDYGEYSIVYSIESLEPLSLNGVASLSVLVTAVDVRYNEIVGEFRVDALHDQGYSALVRTLSSSPLTPEELHISAFMIAPLGAA